MAIRLILTTGPGNHSLMERHYNSLTECPQGIVMYLNRYFVFTHLDTKRGIIQYEETTITELIP